MAPAPSGQPPDSLHTWRSQRAALRQGQWEVYYDGDCAFCRRWAARGQRWCNPQIHWRNFRDPARAPSSEQAATTKDAIAALAPRFDQAAYLIIARHLALPGFHAFRRLTLASPRLWPLLPLAYFPGSTWLGPKVYAWIARHHGPVKRVAQPRA